MKQLPKYNAQTHTHTHTWALAANKMLTDIPWSEPKRDMVFSQKQVDTNTQCDVLLSKPSWVKMSCECGRSTVNYLDSNSDRDADRIWDKALAMANPLGEKKLP